MSSVDPQEMIDDVIKKIPSKLALMMQEMERLRTENTKQKMELDKMSTTFKTFRALKNRQIKDLEAEVKQLRGQIEKVPSGEHGEEQSGKRGGEEDSAADDEVVVRVVAQVRRDRNIVRFRFRNKHILDATLTSVVNRVIAQLDAAGSRPDVYVLSPNLRFAYSTTTLSYANLPPWPLYDIVEDPSKELHVAIDFTFELRKEHNLDPFLSMMDLPVVHGSNQDHGSLNQNHQNKNSDIGMWNGSIGIVGGQENRGGGINCDQMGIQSRKNRGNITKVVRGGGGGARKISNFGDVQQIRRDLENVCSNCGSTVHPSNVCPWWDEWEIDGSWTSPRSPFGL